MVTLNESFDQEFRNGRKGRTMAGSVSFVLAMFFVFQLAFIGVWDLYVLLVLDRETYTVSSYVRAWAQDLPVGVLVLGVVLGHLFWPPVNVRPPHR